MIEQLQHRAYDRFLLWKRVTYFLATSDFQKSYLVVSREDDKKGLDALDKLVEAGDLAGLRDWTRRYTSLPDLSYRQLRDRAQLENVPNYSRLSKAELLATLEELQRGQRSVRPADNPGVQSEVSENGRSD